MSVQMSPGRFSLKADKRRQSTDTCPAQPTSSKLLSCAKMEAYNKTESDMTMPFDQHMSLTRSQFTLRLESG
jgi:hypothetical protein